LLGLRVIVDQCEVAGLQSAINNCNQIKTSPEGDY